VCISNDLIMLPIRIHTLYPLPFTEKALDEVAGHEVYLFLDGFFGHH
jgi:hypothetical protein